MRFLLRLLALGLFFGCLGWWFYAGRNWGWTKNRVAVEKRDEVTEIVFTEYEDRFVPGMELLAAAGAGSLVLGGLSFWRGRRVAL